MATSLVPGTVDVLIVGALPPDLAGLRPALGDDLSGVVRGLRVAAKAVGMGLASATAGTTRRLMQVTPRAVVHLGNAGSYPNSGLGPGRVVTPSRAVLGDAAVLGGRAAFPDPLVTELTPPAPLLAGFAADATVARDAVVTPLAWTADHALAGQIRLGLGVGAENLEAFGIASACALLQVPCVAALGVSHRAGPEWRNEHVASERTASLAAANAILAWLSAGAPGLPHEAP